MARWIGVGADPNSATGGSTWEKLVLPATTKIALPTLFIPATTATVEDQDKPIDRKTEVRGRRGEAAPQSFRVEPIMDIETHAYPTALRNLLRNCIGGTPTSTGTAPAPVESTVEPLQSGFLPTLNVWLLREEQLDRMTGAVVASVEVACGIEGEGTMKASLEGLVHDVEPATGYKDPSGAIGEALPTPTYEGYEYAFMLRDLIAEHGPTGTLVKIENLVGLTFTFNNGMITDPRSKFRAGHHIETREIDTVKHKLWYPAAHKMGPQVVTGKIDLGSLEGAPSALAESKRQVAHADKLVAIYTAGPLGTTPPAEETMTVTFYKHALTGGGADPLVREGDQYASFNFSGYIDPASGNKDVAVKYVGKVAVT
jgi:hypothetical protein